MLIVTTFDNTTAQHITQITCLWLVDEWPPAKNIPMSLYQSKIFVSCQTQSECDRALIRVSSSYHLISFFSFFTKISICRFLKNRWISGFYLFVSGFEALGTLSCWIRFSPACRRWTWTCGGPLRRLSPWRDGSWPPSASAWSRETAWPRNPEKNYRRDVSDLF